MRKLVRSAVGRMAKTTNYAALFFAVAMFAIVANQGLSGVAYAVMVHSSNPPTPVTSSTDPYIVCGNHLCTPGEMPHHPAKVVPVTGAS
jgi:F0F1-type ATP synthase membrane subunit a